jgi:hypothetical protein
MQVSEQSADFSLIKAKCYAVLGIYMSLDLTPVGNRQVGMALDRCGVQSA